MTATPRVSIDQWRALVTVVDAGGYAQASEMLHKAQSAVTYAVKKLESMLEVKVFEVVGRKARLTKTGEVLYRRAKILLEEAASLESAATGLAAGWEPEIRIAADIIFPTWLLLQCCALFAKEQPQTRIELYETVLGGTEEALLERKVDLVISSRVPQGFAGDALMRIRFIPAAHPDHPLHKTGRQLTLQDLRKHRHLTIRDSGTQRQAVSSVGAEQLWIMSHKATSIHAACMGLGFSWFSEETIRSELEQGLLKRLPMREGEERWAELYLVFPDPDYAGSGALRLAHIIRENVKTMAENHSSAICSGIRK